MKSRNDMTVRILKQTDTSFSIRTGEYEISYEPEGKPDGWITIKRCGIDEPAIATKLVNGADLNITDVGDAASIESMKSSRWKTPRKDSHIFRDLTMRETDDAVEITINSERQWAVFKSTILIYKRYPGLIHWTVEATAKRDKAFYTASEPDCRLMTGNELASHDIVRYTAQRCAASGIAYFRDIPMKTDVFYFEDYSSLNDLYRLTGCANPFEYPADGQPGAVKAGKPTPAFQSAGDGETVNPPKPFEHAVESISKFGYDRPYSLKIPKGKKLVLADTYLYLKPTVKTDNISVCKSYVNSLADIYRFIYKPPILDTDWAGTVVPRLVKDVMRKENTNRAEDGSLIPRAYVSFDYADNQVWTVAQLLQPLMEYTKRYPHQQGAIKLQKELEKSLPLFYDKQLKWITSNPPPIQPDAYFHSVYIFIPDIMVADLALAGNKDAVEMIQGCRDRLLLMGKRCGYVFADVWLEDFSKQRGLYQFDETGAYIYVMMALYALSGDKDMECLESAKAAAEKLTNRCLDLGYEICVTASGIVGCEKLFKATGDTRYRDIAYIPLANTLKDAWLWECDYGMGEKITTFWAFNVTPAAPTSAEFEASRTRLLLKNYQALAGGHISPELNALLGDSWRRGPTQSRFALPPFLVKAGASKYMAAEGKSETNSGEIRYDQMIPLEDFYTGWGTDLEWCLANPKLGVVGQEIYGAGGPIWYAVWQDEIDAKE
ncbi:MAG: hypothetical protein ACYC0V_12815 [Armatimonadota bacterium]